MVFYITLFLLITSCYDEEVISSQLQYVSLSTKTDTNALKVEIDLKKDQLNYYEKLDSGYTINDFLFLDTASFSNIHKNYIPNELNEVVHNLDLFAFDTSEFMVPYSFIQLAKDWNYFAYEVVETKHYNNIFVYKKIESTYRCIDTLYGNSISVNPTTKSDALDIIVLEAYWRDLRPRNIEYYQFDGFKYELKKVEEGKWRKDGED